MYLNKKLYEIVSSSALSPDPVLDFTVGSDVCIDGVHPNNLGADCGIFRNSDGEIAWRTQKLGRVVVKVLIHEFVDEICYETRALLGST